jgi:type VI secretion system secreted protein VgrG
MTYTQATRVFEVDTPLGKDVLLLRAFSGTEAISQLFSFELDMLSENDAISYDSIVGKNVTIRITLADESDRYLNGFISQFVQRGRDTNLTAYHATMVPWFWFLSQTTDCRIFQNKKVPDIITQVFGEYGFTDFEVRLFGSYSPREYCVQYRETDCHFLSRLMEEEGIFYFFEHQAGKHVLVMGDDVGSHKVCPNQATAKCDLPTVYVRSEDRITGWEDHENYRPGVVTHTDYNFEMPTTSLMATAKGKQKYEKYDYPGEYKTKGDGDRLARIRLQEQQMPQAVIRGRSDCRAFGAGYHFTLEDHYRGDLNKDYLLTAVSHTAIQNPNYRSGTGGAETEYSNSFQCIPYATPFRPMRTNLIPVVGGPQTAMVVGPPGEEIFTDKYGRVKVQFYWDREGKFNDNSSCWIRVSQPWAGKTWGGIEIPRIGQEVVVDFLEGDPDRPLITGRVYNQGQMPPWALPAKKNVSGVKSNSTKGGGGYNELSFDDTKGSEVVTVHAQRDMNTKVENNVTITVLGLHHESVKKEIVVKSDDQIYMEAKTHITLKVGDSLLYMDNAGNIKLEGKSILIQGSNIVAINP